jgi:hypothetical protein
MRRNITENAGTFLGDGARSSLAAAHEEWVRRKKEEALRARGQITPGSTTSRSYHNYYNNYEEDTPGKRNAGSSQLAPNSSSPNSHSYDNKDNTNTLPLSEYEKQAAFESWLEHQHKQDMAQLDAHLRQERQLLLIARDKKAFSVTQC